MQTIDHRVVAAPRFWFFGRSSREAGVPSVDLEHAKNVNLHLHESGMAVSTCARPVASAVEGLRPPATPADHRAADAADAMEKGAAREVFPELERPLQRATRSSGSSSSSPRLHKFRIARSEDKLEYRLTTEDGDFLMFARTCLEARTVSLFLYDPEGGSPLYDPALPAFVMSFDEGRTEWKLTRSKCGCCQNGPERLSCDHVDKVRFAHVRHSSVKIGDGDFHCMEIQLPGFPSLQGDAPASLKLVTREPTWNEDIDSLVLDFRGRRILSSAKNFQLVSSDAPHRTICQHAKLDNDVFSLDFGFPLSTVQAFGISLTTMLWQ